MLWDAHFRLRTALVYVPDALSRLSFTFAALGDRKFLAGITIYNAKTALQKQLGYEGGSGSQKSVDINGLYGLDPA